MKLREKIRQWLFGEELENLNKAVDSYNKACAQLNRCESMLDYSLYATRESQRIADDARKLINSICDVGVDIHREEHPVSWAVICVHGKMDYVKFIPISQKNIREISSFLKMFEYSNRVQDTPFRFVGNDYILNW